MQKIIIAGVLFMMMGLAVSISHKQEIKHYVEAKLLKTEATKATKVIRIDPIPPKSNQHDTAAIQDAANAAKKVISFDDLTIDEAFLGTREGLPLVDLNDIEIDVVRALSKEEMGIETNSSVFSNNAFYGDNADECKYHTKKAYLKIDFNNNRMFCGDNTIYEKYKDRLKISNGDSSNLISSEEIPPLKLKLMLKSCNESLDKTQADNQDLQRKILTYSTDKDADKTKSIIAMQNDRLNAQRVEIEELQKQLVELQKNQVVKQ